MAIYRRNFSFIKIDVSRFEFHRRLFQVANMIYIIICLEIGEAQSRLQSNIGTDDCQVYWHTYTSLVLNGLSLAIRVTAAGCIHMTVEFPR